MPIRKPPQNDEQLDLFSAIFSDVSNRDTRETMEFPFLSLSKKPRFKPIHYSSPNGTRVMVSGGEPHGIASIFDYDLIIWLLSQIRHSINRGEKVSRRIQFNRHSYLRDVRKHSSGDEYKRLERSIARLKNTTITTTIRAEREVVMFSWIEFARIVRDEKGRFCKAEVVIPEWLFDAVKNKKLVLSINRDYFLLTSGIERWLYRLLKKSAGNQVTGWSWKIDHLHERSGTTQQRKYFAREIRKIVSSGKLLDYKLQLKEQGGSPYLHAVAEKPTRHMHVAARPKSASSSGLRLRTTTFEEAKALAPSHDVYWLHQKWLTFNEGRESTIKNSDAAFLAFCKTHAQKNPVPNR